MIFIFDINIKKKYEWCNITENMSIVMSFQTEYEHILSNNDPVYREELHSQVSIMWNYLWLEMQKYLNNSSARIDCKVYFQYFYKRWINNWQLWR